MHQEWCIVQPFAEKLTDAVNKANADTEWRDRVMTLEMEMLHQKHIGFEEGLEKGRKEERKDSILKVLKKKSISETADLFETSIEEIEEIAKEASK